MLIQSHEGMIELLPALPQEWPEGSFEGVCARGGFELSFSWERAELTHLEVLSKSGQSCRIKTGNAVRVLLNGEEVNIEKHPDGSIEFPTTKGTRHVVEPL
jgi:alpha-L-fucosidase 2